MNNLLDFRFDKLGSANEELVTTCTSDTKYSSGMSRRDSLKWFSVIATTAVLPSISGCNILKVAEADVQGHWPDIELKPIMTTGYGKDPNLLVPPQSPWPKTLTTEQLALVAVLSDIICPREETIPAATEVKVPDVINEWVSAPYEIQQEHRLHLLSGFQWLDDESVLRFKQNFVNLSESQQLAIINDIAYDNENTKVEFKSMAQVFNLLRQLVLSAFFSSPEGTKDIGYLGNVPIMTDYPGPTDEAMAHLDGVLDELGLSL